MLRATSSRERQRLLLTTTYCLLLTTTYCLLHTSSRERQQSRSVGSRLPSAVSAASLAVSLGGRATPAISSRHVELTDAHWRRASAGSCASVSGTAHTGCSCSQRAWHACHTLKSALARPRRASHAAARGAKGARWGEAHSLCSAMPG